MLHGYHSTPGAHALYSDKSWCDFVALQPGHLNSDDGSNNAQSAGYWSGVYSTTNNKPIMVVEAHYAHLNENSQVGYFGPAPTAAGMRADADGMIANDPQNGRLIGITYGDWYRVVWCDASDGLKFDNPLADGFANGVATTRFPSGSPGASYAGVANVIGNDGETEYLNALGIVGPPPPDPVTVLPGADIQAAIDAAPNFGIVNLTADTIYDEVQLTIPAGKTVTLQGSGAWDSALDTGNLLMGGVLVTGFVAVGANWRADWPNTAISRLQGSTENYNIWSRARDRLTCTLDEGWLHHASSVVEMDAGLPTNMLGTSGQFLFEYGAQAVWVDTDPTGKRVALSTVNRVISGPGTLLLKDVSVGLSRSNTQEGMIRPEGPDWVLDGVEVFSSAGVGVQGKSFRTHLIGCHIHHNGQLGLGDSSSVNTTSGVDNTSGGICEETLIEYNNMNWYHPGWEAGATKVAWHDDYIFRHNEVRFNYGMGLWDDINCVNAAYRFNHVHQNWYAGIHHEIGYSGLVEWNHVELNGTWPTRNVGASTTFPNQSNDANHNIGWSSVPGIVISESNGLMDRLGGLGYGILVRNNLVDDNRGGILLRQINRDGDGSNPGGTAYHNIGISVDNNDVWWDDTAGGWPGAAVGPIHGNANSHPTHDPTASASQNAFQNNDYTINGGEILPANSKFEWNGGKNFAGWQAEGQDTATAGSGVPPEDYGLTVTTPPTPTGTDGYFLFPGTNAQYVTTPDSPNLSIPSKFRVDVLAAMTDWTPPSLWEALVGKYEYVNNQAGWRLTTTTTPSLRFESTPDGNPSNNIWGDVTLPAWANDSLHWVRFDYDASIGVFEALSSDDEVNWTSIASGTFQPHTVFDSSGPVEIGRVGGVADNFFTGKMYAVRIYNNDVLVADPDFRNNAQAVGGDWANGGVDSLGNQWSVVGPLQYVPPTTEDQILLMEDYGFPASFTLDYIEPDAVKQYVVFAAPFALSMTGTGAAVGADETVGFAVPFAFTLAGFGPETIAMNQSVTFTDPFAFTLAGSNPTAITPPLTPIVQAGIVSVQYGYFARFVPDEPQNSVLRLGGTDGHAWVSATGLDVATDMEIQWYGSMDTWYPAYTSAPYPLNQSSHYEVHGLLSRDFDVLTGWQFFLASHTGVDGPAWTFKFGEGQNQANQMRGPLSWAVPDGWANESERWLKIESTADEGGLWVVELFHSDDALTWVSLGEGSGIGVGDFLASSSPLTIGKGVREVGSDPLPDNPSLEGYASGTVNRVIVKDGIGGSSVVDVDFTDKTPGEPIVASTGQTVVLAGDASLEGTSAERLVLVPTGRSQHIGFQTAEGFEKVSETFRWLSGSEDEVMATMAQTYASSISDTTENLTDAVNATLRTLGYTHPDGTDLT